MSKARFFLPFPDYFHARGRISRLQYLVFMLAYIITTYVVLFAVILNRPPATEYTGIDISLLIISGALFTAWMYFGYCFQAKRLHDIAWPAALALIYLVQIPVLLAAAWAEYFMTVPDSVTDGVKALQNVCNAAGLIIGLFALFKPGDRGPNKYGPDPLQPVEPDTSVF